MTSHLRRSAPDTASESRRKLRFHLGLVAMGGTLLATYVATLSPGVTPSDGPEIATAVARLGVIHPTGYPLFTLLGHLFLALPLPGEAVVRLEVFNSLWGVAAAIFVALTVRALTRLVLPELGSSPPTMRAAIDVTAIASGFALGIAPLLWDQVRIPEVYAMHVGLVCAGLYAWSRFEVTRRDRYIVVAAIPMGLGLAHHVTMVYMLPAATLYVLWRRPTVLINWLFLPLQPVVQRLRPSWRGHKFWRGTWVVGAGCILGALPLLSYGYFIWANEHTTAVSWGGVDDWSGLHAHMTGRQYRSFMKGFGYEKFWPRVGVLPSWFHQQYTGAAALPWLAGLVLLWRRATGYAVFITAFLALNIYHAAQYSVSDYRNYHLPSVAASAVLVGVGASWIVASLPGLAKRLPPPTWARVQLAAACTLAGGYLVAAVGRADHRLHVRVGGASYAAAVSREVPAGAVYLSLGDGKVFPMFYEQHVLERGREFAVVDVRMMHRPWYRKGYLLARHPTACDPLSELYRHDFDRWTRECADYRQRLDLESSTSWLKLDVGPHRGGRRKPREPAWDHKIITGGNPSCRQPSYRGKHPVDCQCWDANEYSRDFDHACVLADEDEEGGIVRMHKQAMYAHRMVEDHIDERPVFEHGVFTRWLDGAKNPRKWNGPAYQRISGVYHLINRGRTNEVFYWHELDEVDPCAQNRLVPLPARDFAPPRPQSVPAKERRAYEPNPRPQLLAQSYLAATANADSDDGSNTFSRHDSVWLELKWFERRRYDQKRRNNQGQAIRHGIKLCVYEPHGRKIGTYATRSGGTSNLQLLAASEATATGTYTIEGCSVGDVSTSTPEATIAAQDCVFPILEYTFDVLPE